MKLINYQLQTQIEWLKDIKSSKFFKEYLQTILEDTVKPYHQRCDYIGLSLYEIKSKIDFLSKDITELQNLKKKLATSLDIAKELTAEIFLENGIDRIDGNIISSLTLTKASSKTNHVITIIDENALMELGHVTFSVDTQSVEDAIKTKDGLEKLKDFIEIDSTTVITPVKVKVNTKKSSTTTRKTDEILSIEESQAA